MKKDARLLLNKKKWNKTPQRPVGGDRRVAGNTIDARKILNLKRAKKVSSRKGIFPRSSKASTSLAVSTVKKAFPPFSKFQSPEKQVELSSDGNIWITAQAKDSHVGTKPKRFTQNLGIPRHSPKQVQWTPADVDMDNLEHIGIGDLIDMESLPPAVIPTNVQSRNRLSSSQRSLAQEVLGMRNTMVADQVASTSGYQSARIIVTNLRASVSKQDLMELFGDIGLVKSADLTQPGTAFIEFYNKEDASQACSIYHNRLLDGQPMQCFLQTNSIPQRTSVSQRLGERVQAVAPISLTSSSSFSSNPRSRYNPRDVRFTVKLT